MEPNQAIYDSTEVVKTYVEGELDLQLAEKIVFSGLKDKLSGWNVLDLGMGTGRTSAHLLPICRNYLGVDYADSMVSFCRARFQDHDGRLFRYGDARKLDFLSPCTFDFVVFSFNGIDCVDLEGRMKILSEVCRVLKPGGYFYLSTHNLRFDLLKYHSIRARGGPRELWRSIRRFFEFRALNPGYGRIRTGGQAFLRDGAASFKLSLAYQGAIHQAGELRAAGFADVEVYSHNEPKKLTPEEADANRDPWLHYLARKRK